MMKQILTAIITVVTALFCCFLQAEESEDFLAKAQQYEKESAYRDAAQAYKDAAFMANNATVKANALYQAAAMFRKAKLYGKEFDCLEELLKNYPAHVDFAKAVDRQYDIADKFFQGHRDLIVSWIPFIKDSDRTLDFYLAVLKHAPCAKQSADARLRVAEIYLEKDDIEKAVPYLRELGSMYAGSEAAHYADFELVRIYMEQVHRGDGDGKWGQYASEKLKKYIERYPDDPKIPWVKKSLDEVNAISSERLYNIAVFYHRQDRDDLAQRYLAQILREQGITENTKKAEALLAEIDKNYNAPDPDDPARVKNYQAEYVRTTIPKEYGSVMVVPENSDGKWLFPIVNLKQDIIKDSRDPETDEPADNEVKK